MGWRFRKIKSFGIFRTILSKKGVGTSVGIPGLRFGINPDGRRYYSLGFPGTGLYFIKYLKKNGEQNAATTQNHSSVAPKKLTNLQVQKIDIDAISKKF
jgi:hypothetical protein